MPKNLTVLITTAFFVASCSTATPEEVPQNVEEQTSDQNSQSEDVVIVDATETSEPISSATADECMTAVGSASVECHDDHIVIESNGLPEHEVMVGIGAGAWNGQWPTAQDYTGNNAFFIPTLFELVEDPHYFVRNVAGVTANGIPIFLPTAPGRAGSEECLDLPLTEGALPQGECLRDPVGVGEMDECGGHTGRGNDYHYHATPTCLLADFDLTAIAGYMLDGIPVYAEPLEGATSYGECGAYISPDGIIHYVFTEEYPYVTACLLGQYDEGPRTQGSEVFTDGHDNHDLGAITQYFIDENDCQHMVFGDETVIIHCDDH